MKTISSSNTRKYISDLLDEVRETGESIAIKRQKNIEAVLIKFPREYSIAFSDVTNLNAYGQAFDFLADEPDTYSRADIKAKYA